MKIKSESIGTWRELKKKSWFISDPPPPLHTHSCLAKFKNTSNFKPTRVLNLGEQMRENGASESRREMDREEREEVLAFDLNVGFWKGKEKEKRIFYSKFISKHFSNHYN